jgi:hypothetical protein
LSVPQDQVHLVVDQPDFHLARGGLLRVRVRGRLRIQFVDLGGDHVRVDPEFAQRPGRHAVLRPQHRLTGWELFEQLDEKPWVTPAKAEAETGVSRSALRSWYRNGEIQSRLVDGLNGPQRLVQLDTVIVGTTAVRVEPSRLTSRRHGGPRNRGRRMARTRHTLAFRPLPGPRSSL